MKKARAKLSIEDLKHVHIDALQEICNIGMGHAATALSQMIGKPVHLNVPQVKLAPLAEVPELIGGAEQVVAGIYLQIWGDVQGNILLVFPKESVKSLGNLLTGAEAGKDMVLSEIHASALKEVANILACSYLSTMEQLLKITLIPSVPSLAFDMVGAIMDYILIELGKKTDTTLIIKAEFFAKEQEISGHFFLLPDPQSLELILRAGRVLEGTEKD